MESLLGIGLVCVSQRVLVIQLKSQLVGTQFEWEHATLPSPALDSDLLVLSECWTSFHLV